MYVTQVSPFVSLRLLIGQAPITGLRKGVKTLHTMFQDSQIDTKQRRHSVDGMITCGAKTHSVLQTTGRE